MPGPIDIRPLRDGDLERVVTLYNDGGFGPASGGQPLTARDLQSWLTRKGTYLFLVAEDRQEQSIVGTLGLVFESEQRVARPGEVYASSFFIAPEHRNGMIPSQLFMQALWSLVQDGYTSIGATVSPANAVALALYKRIGLYRLHAYDPDYDGQVELCGYQPLIMRAIQHLYPPDSPDWADMPHRESPWRFLTPTRSLRTNSADTELWHGLEVVTYEIHAETLHFLFRIDVASGGLVEMQANAVHFCMYPQPEQQVLIGETGHLVCELTNHAPESRSYALVDEGGPVLVPRVFGPGETRRTEIPFVCEQSGLRILRYTLHMGKQTQDVQVGVFASKRIEAARVWPLQMVEAEKSVRITLRLTNNGTLSLTGTLRLHAPTLYGHLCSSDGVDLPAGGAAEYVFCCERAGSGLHAITLIVDTADGESVYAEAVMQPVLSPEQVVAYQEGGEYVLESPEVRVSLNEETGYLRAWDKSHACVVLYEVWPAIGPMQSGGLKRSSHRVIRRLAGKDDELILREDRDDGSALQRTLRLSTAGVLEISQCWMPADTNKAVGTQFIDPKVSLKTFGECAFRQDTLTVPLRTGWQRRAVVYGGYPYRLHEYEMVPTADLPRTNEGYAQNWSAFEEHGLTVGMLWEDADEVCFGGHWMPSLLFERATGDQPVALPRYAYVIGRGGAEWMAALWNQFSVAGSLDDVQVPMPAYEERAKLPVVARLQQWKNRSTIQPGSTSEVRLSTTPKGYRLENDVLALHMGSDGVANALTYKGISLLQTAGPRPKPFGDNGTWLGGLHPALIHQAPALLGSLLCDTSNLLYWQVEAEPMDRQGWRGVKLQHGDLCVRLQMQPGQPLLRLLVEYRNQGPATESFHLLLHLFVRSQQRQVAKKVYYESQESMHCLIEERKNRRIYANDWSIIAPGKGLAMALWAEPGTEMEIATYEWPHDGFQQILMLPFSVEPGGVKQACCYLLVDTFEHLLTLAGSDDGDSDVQRSEAIGVLV